jgi:hypothetical protein
MAWIQDLLAAKWMLPQEQMPAPAEQPTPGWLQDMVNQIKPLFDQASPDEKIAFVSTLFA